MYSLSNALRRGRLLCPTAARCIMLPVLVKERWGEELERSDFARREVGPHGQNGTANVDAESFWKNYNYTPSFASLANQNILCC